MTPEMSTSFGTALGTIKTDVIGLVLIALPIVLAIVGLGIAIRYGIKFVRGAAK